MLQKVIVRFLKKISGFLIYAIILIWLLTLFLVLANILERRSLTPLWELSKNYLGGPLWIVKSIGIFIVAYFIDDSIVEIENEDNNKEAEDKDE